MWGTDGIIFDTTPRYGGGEFFLMTDDEILAYSEAHDNSHIFDPEPVSGHSDLRTRRLNRGGVKGMILGVIGGLGPMATARFMNGMVIQMTDASCDQEHLEMIIHNCPQIPDRTAYILGKSDKDPAPPMIRAGRALAGEGASCIAIPCITAHYFHRELSDGIGIPIINAITETGHELIRSGARRIGIMATDGTIRSGIFQKELEEKGLEIVLPDEVEPEIHNGCEL